MPPSLPAGPGPGRPAESAGPPRASSACTPTTPGTSPAGTIPWAAGWPADCSPVAAIDCGTNSTRLLVAGPGGVTLVRLMQITRLGRGVDRTRRLAPDAIERTLSVLRDFRAVLDENGVGRVRMTATSAARDATNREDFLAAAADIVGVRPELLAGEEEGRLSFRGATAELPPSSAPWLVADIGGGSTELIAGGEAGGRPEAVRSLDVGCVRISERFLPSDPPDAGADRRPPGPLSGTSWRLSTGPKPAFGRAATLVGLAGHSGRPGGHRPAAPGLRPPAAAPLSA